MAEKLFFIIVERQKTETSNQKVGKLAGFLRHPGKSPVYAGLMRDEQNNLTCKLPAK